MIAKLTLIAALAVAPMAMAQESPPPTAEQISAARAIADRLIADADAEGVFVNVTKDGIARVRHVASGMTCLFDGGSEDRIYLFPTGARGDDVGCISRDDALSIDLTLYATRYQPLPAESAVLADAERAIRNRWPDAVRYPLGLPSLTVEGQSPTLMAGYKIRLGDQDKLTLALVTHRGEWGFKARATGPYEDAMGVGLYAGVLLEGALSDREAR